jgi:acetyl-CoA carboxylase biotin carboxyl carrier protein
VNTLNESKTKEESKMDINLLKKLIKVVEKSEITEFSVQEGDLKVKISKNSKNNSAVTFQSSPGTVPMQAAAPEQKAETQAAPPSEKEIEPAPSGLHEIKSPIVGTFYRAPAPDADPYIKVGDHVSEGSVLCIVEAMKLMNEIESDISGKVVKILVDNSAPVEYNQPLFLIEKD